MIHKHIKSHGTHHIGLLLFFFFFILLAYYTRENKQVEIMVLTTMTILYVGYGIMHHALTHTLTGKIVVEYSAMAGLGLIIALFLFTGFSL